MPIFMSADYNKDFPIVLIKTYYDPNTDYDSDLNPATGVYEAGAGSTNYIANNLYFKNIKFTEYRMLEYVKKNENGFNDIIEECVPSTK